MNRDEFKDAVREQAFTIEEPYEGAGRRIVHCRAGGFGADWDEADVLDLIDRALDIGWAEDGSIGKALGHELYVIAPWKPDDKRTTGFAFQIKQPTPVLGEGADQ